MKSERKDVVLTFRVTKTDFEMIRKAAEKEKLDISDYVRLAIMMDIALFHNRTFAWKKMARNLIHKAVEVFDDKINALEERAIERKLDDLYDQVVNGVPSATTVKTQ